jgi:UDP-N-acetylmuramoyl-L-alanyl-D-glutamate--2,6-diaminopimelate ligase
VPLRPPRRNGTRWRSTSDRRAGLPAPDRRRRARSWPGRARLTLGASHAGACTRGCGVAAYRWLGPPGPLWLTALADHTERVIPGALFACVPGSRLDGHAFAPAALARGARALLVSRPLPGIPAVQVLVSEVRPALAALAREWYGRPDLNLHLFGVTGTNGKTTTTYFLQAGLRAAGVACGIVGTVAYRVGDAVEPARLTTPGSVDFYRLLRAMADAGLGAAAVEASSHALAQGRVGGHVFDAAVFTNLGRDHLDYHGTAEAYLRAKALLFVPRSVSKPFPAVAALPADDPAGRRLADGIPPGRRVVTYAVEAPADVRADVLHRSGSGSVVRISGAYGSGTVRLSLPGAHNVRNALAAAAALLASGVPFAAVARGLPTLQRVPGRCERVDAGQPFDVFVDFAHNPHGLRAALTALRPAGGGRLIAVVGAKGEDGDREKRRLMGRVAAELADVVIVTTDDPYDEDPASIAAQLLRGAAEARRDGLHVILDRREAIRAAIGLARPGDAVVVAGRGHEALQPVGDRLVPLSDREACLQALREIRARAGPALGDPRFTRVP